MVDILPQTPEAMNDVAAVTRRMRVMQFGEPMVQRMEQAGRTFGAAPKAAPIGPISAPAEAPGIIARTAGKLPGLGARFVRGGLALAPVAGALGAATDTQENVNELANTTGLDYNSFAGRVGANAVNFLKQTGNAATFGGAGALGRGIANVLGGESFFSPYKAPAATTPASAAVPESVITPTTPVAPGAVQRDPNMVDLVGGGQARPEAMFADLPNDVLVPAPGNGAFKRTTPGNVGAAQAIYAPGEAGPGAVSVSAPGRRGLPDVGAFFGATAHLRNIAQDNALKAAAAKVQLEYGPKAATAENERLRTQLAIQHLLENPGDTAGAAAVAAGRSQGVGAYSTIPSITGNDVITTNRRTGEANIQTPKRFATEQHVSADMANRKMTRAQVISAYEKQGIDTSRLKK